MKQCKIKILKLLVDDAHTYEHNLLNKTTLLKIKLLNKCPSEITNDFIDKVDRYKNNEEIKRKRKNIFKLKRLQNKQLNELRLNKDWILNCTEKTIPENVAKILQLGPDFCGSIKEIPIMEIITNVEYGLVDETETIKNRIRLGMTGIIKNKINKSTNCNNNNDGMQRILNKNIKETNIFIKANPELVICRADKSNKTVVLSEQQYNNKMMLLLNDKNTYKENKHDPTSTIQNKMNKLIKKWKDNGQIESDLAKKLTTYNGVAPRIYGLPKVHKASIPLRPIVCNNIAPSYKISKFLTEIISNVTNSNGFSVKDSWQFREFISHQIIPKNHILCSLDVISLYTNIPIDLAMRSIKSRWTQIKNFTSLSETNFIEAAELCLNHTYFKYKDKNYFQKVGVAMGSPLSAPIANLVMEDLENTI